MISICFVFLVGIQGDMHYMVLPLATGMALSMTLFALQKSRPNAKRVLWPRIDQKTCLKAITLSECFKFHIFSYRILHIIVISLFLFNAFFFLDILNKLWPKDDFFLMNILFVCFERFHSYGDSQCFGRRRSSHKSESTRNSSCSTCRRDLVCDHHNIMFYSSSSRSVRVQCIIQQRLISTDC
jgi:hypothetical protein